MYIFIPSLCIVCGVSTFGSVFYLLREGNITFIFYTNWACLIASFTFTELLPIGGCLILLFHDFIILIFDFPRLVLDISWHFRPSKNVEKCREMSRNVEKCREKSRNVEKCRVLSNFVALAVWEGVGGIK